MTTKAHLLARQLMVVALMGGTIIVPADAADREARNMQAIAAVTLDEKPKPEVSVQNLNNPRSSTTGVQKLKTGAHDVDGLNRMISAAIAVTAVKEPLTIEEVKQKPSEPMNDEEYWETITQNRSFDVRATVKAAYADVGKTFPTGWSAEGECIMGVKRWIESGGGTWGPGGVPMDNYRPATEIALEDMQAGDVVQYFYTASPDSWVSGIHTVLITGNNFDGSYKIVESNNPGGSGLVSSTDKWVPQPPSGFVAKAFRF